MSAGECKNVRTAAKRQPCQRTGIIAPQQEVGEDRAAVAKSRGMSRSSGHVQHQGASVRRSGPAHGSGGRGEHAFQQRRYGDRAITPRERRSDSSARSGTGRGDRIQAYGPHKRRAAVRPGRRPPNLGSMLGDSRALRRSPPRRCPCSRIMAGKPRRCTEGTRNLRQGVVRESAGLPFAKEGYSWEDIEVRRPGSRLPERSGEQAGPFCVGI